MSREALPAILASGVAMAIPLLLAGLGELFAERAGVINVGLEGMMLVGALAGVAGAFFGHSVWLGVLSGVASGAGMAALFALVAVNRGADQVVTGTALNLLALGGTGAAFRALTERLTAPMISPVFSREAVPGLSRLPVVGEAFFHQNALVYLAYLLLPVASLAL